MNPIANTITTPTPAPAPDAAALTPAPPQPVPAAVDPALRMGMIAGFNSWREITLTMILPLSPVVVDALVESHNVDLANKVRECSEYTAVTDLQTKERDLGAQLAVEKARLATASAKKSELAVTTQAKDLPGVLASANKEIADLTHQAADTEAALVAVQQARAAATPALARKIVECGQKAASERATAACERKEAALVIAAQKVADHVAEAALQEVFWRFAMAPLIATALARKLGCGELISLDGQVSPHLRTVEAPPAPKTDDHVRSWNEAFIPGKPPPQPAREPRPGDVIGKIEWARG
jgi:hypothetical protein